jgi:hypothetical protein
MNMALSLRELSVVELVGGNFHHTTLNGGVLALIT